jgi:hypothetical protein
MRCQTTWFFVDSHATEFSTGEGCFPLCVLCWSELTPDERLPFYRKLYEEWAAHDSALDSSLWEKMKAAVLAEGGGPETEEAWPDVVRDEI